MTTFEAFHVRRLEPAEREDAGRLAEEAGVAGVYVVNSLDAAHRDDRALGVHSADEELIGLVWLGHRGNLIVLERRPLEPVLVASALAGAGIGGWRVALGPDPIVRALVARERQMPLVDRIQIYYAAREAATVPGSVGVRPAVRADARALVDASLDLSESDLHVPAWRVHKGWLRDSVRRRIRDGRTFVVGPVGDPQCKLDIGSRGRGGAVLEGVHTRPEVRGRGLAAALVAGVIDRLVADGAPITCLHVAEENAPARRAYERAGMVASGACRLMLRD